MQRHLSLEKDFMNYSIDDRLYGSLLHLATYHPVEKYVYITKQKLNLNRNELRKYCTSSGEEIKPDKFRRLIQKMIDNELLTEISIPIDNKNLPGYRFNKPEGRYQPIYDDMLWYLACTRNLHVIKIYIYLLNKFLWKPSYIFTKNELYVAIGYAEGTKPRKLVVELVDNVLNSLRREGIIDYEDLFEEQCLEDGRIVPIHRYELKKVAKNTTDLCITMKR